MVDYSRYLRAVPLFAGLSDEELALLGVHARRRSYEDGEVLFMQGDPGHGLFIVLSGLVSLDRTNSFGEVIHIARRGVGEHVGEMALLDGQPRSTDGRASGFTEVLMLERDGFRRALTRSSALAERIIVALTTRLREAADRMSQLQSLDVLGRLAAEILRMAEQEGEQRPDGTIHMPSRVSQQLLADRTGTTRESVNRAFTRLLKDGAISRDRGRITILRPAYLRKRARI